MKPVLATFILLMFCSSALFSVENNYGMNNLLDSAEANYKRGNYEASIALYDSVLNAGFESFEVYFNTGNAYYKTNNITRAILNYERAKLIMPEDEDLIFNLDLANKYIVDKIDILPEFIVTSWFKKLTMATTADNYAWYSLIVFIVSILLFGLFFFSTITAIRKTGFWLGILVLLISLSFLFLALKQKFYIEHNKAAIVFSPSVTVKSSPDESGNDLFLIHEGLKVTIEDKIGDWVKIRLADGNVGWMEESGVQEI